MLLVVVTMMGLLDGAVSLPEGATCNFSWDFDSFLGKRLTNQVIETKEGISLLQCVRECLDMDSTVCRSVNYNRQQRKCQLNSMDERLVPWDMSSSAGWNYYHKRISSPDRIAQYNGAHCYVKKCAPGTSEFLDMCIEVTPSKPGSFDASWSKCQQKYGDLLHIYNQEVYDHVLSLVEPYGNEARFYIGFTRREDNVLYWMNGGAVDTSKFFLFGEPLNGGGIENCGGLENRNAQYGINDVSCELDWSYICQYNQYVYTLW